MTLINLSTLSTALGGPIPTSATLTATYWSGYAPFVRIEGSDVIFPDPITVTFTAGVPSAPINMDPTDGLACVKWRFSSSDLDRPFEIYTSIPASGTVDFADLPVVDPVSFTQVESVQQIVQTALALSDSLIASTLADSGSASSRVISSTYVSVRKSDGTHVIGSKFVVLTLTADGAGIGDIAVYDSLEEVG